MPLEIEYVTPSTGAKAGYHVVTQVAIDYEMVATVATVASYLSKDAKDGGKFPMYAQQIAVSGLPDKGVDARDFAETALAAVAPTESSVPTSMNRYALAGAEIVD